MSRPAIKPSVDDPAAIEFLCNSLVSGMSMSVACRQDECPAERIVYEKMARDEDFRRIIARAREAQQHAIIDQTVDMADAATPENWQMVRMQIWARQWRAGKLAPKTYGDKVTQEHTGTDGSPVAFVLYGHPEAKDAEAWQQDNPPPK